MENGHLPAPMLCLTICAYRKEGMDEEEYRNYMTKVHAPLVQGLVINYGIDKFTMVSEMRRRKSSYQLSLLVPRQSCLLVPAPRRELFRLANLKHGLNRHTILSLPAL